MSLTSWHRKGLAFFERRPQLQKRILAGGFWATLVKGLSMPLNLAVVALLARLLSPEDMGIYFFAFSLVATASTLGMLGMGHTVVRLVAASIATGDTVTVRKAVQQALMWGIIGATAAATVMAIFGTALGLPGSIVLFVSAWGLVQTGQNLVAEALRGFDDIRLATIFKNRSITNAIVAVVLLVFWLSNLRIDLKLVISIIVFVSFGADLFGLLLLWGRLNRQAPAHSNASAQPRLRIFSQALPVWGTDTMNIIRTQIGVWVVAAFLSKEEVALYGSANRLVFLVSLPLVTVVNALIPPIIAELYAQRQIDKLERTVRGLATAASIVAFILTVIFVAGGHLILRVLYGEFYADGWIILGLLAVAQLINVMSGSCAPTLIMTGHQKVLMNVAVVATIVTVVSTIVGAHLWGIVGVAIAVATGLVVENLLMILNARKAAGIWTHIKLSWK